MINVFLLIFILLALYYGYFVFSLSKGLDKLKTNDITTDSNKSVSVIVAFKDEQSNLENLLNCLISQDFKNSFEVVLVNDHSQDRSLEIIKNFESKHDFKIVNLSDIDGNFSGKKHALKTGIENSNGEIILLTDADCTMGKSWVTSIVQNFTENVGFISGPVKYSKGFNLFTKIQELEFSGLIISGAGLIGLGQPTITNGANAAYLRSAYEEIGGFQNYMELTSGDDEIIMQNIHNKTNYKVKYCVDNRAVVTTFPSPDLKSFISQRQRWASKGLFYKDNLLYLKLILLFLFFLGLIVQPIIGVFVNNLFLSSFLISFMIKMFVDFNTLKKGFKKIFGEEKLTGFFQAELFHIPYIIISSILGLLGNYNWKSRKIKR